ncbi:hypothetical protein GUJ93_ZPchr0012g21582 [Zizania palustris]|uniref:Plant heme peroxidase family profile domain-containing protein n=1 Tax=Zizania palustris TaxID=103762 RepID=A0A8J5WNZ2_ZIZPA|nr:hypothetical protein GUJ93_ZPchr0012g21582 [Zizania palustris]
MIGEKQAEQDVNSLKGFDLVAKIKQKLEAECPGMVSCTDFLAIAAKDAVVLVGGPYWDVPVGRLDSKKTSLDLANRDITTAQQGLVTLISKFWEKGLDATDMVALCWIPHNQICPLKDICPLDGDDDNISAMNSHTSSTFDNAYFQMLINGEGLLYSDQATRRPTPSTSTGLTLTRSSSSSPTPC